MYLGLDQITGRKLTGADHLRQSIRDVLSTPIGSRVTLREYGSRLFELLDAPQTPALEVELTIAVSEALAKWEPRFQLRQVKNTLTASGNVVLTLYGTDPDGKDFVFDNVKIFRPVAPPKAKPIKGVTPLPSGETAIDIIPGYATGGVAL